MFIYLYLLIFGLLAEASPIKPRSVPHFVFAGDAPWSLAAETYASALHCPNGNPTAKSPPVLLVHGTFADGAQSWGETYVPALLADGFTACYLELPELAGIDMQVSAEFVAYGLHYISYLAGGAKTAVITHSQGGPDTQWAFAWWPSSWAVTSAYLPLSPDLLGLTDAKPIFQAICPAIKCEPSIWQQLRDSNFETALRQHYFRAMVPSTLQWTNNDEIVTPPRDNALLPGGTTIGIQEVCPGRIQDHIYMILDAVAYAVVKDALKHGGTAKISRVLSDNPKVCAQLYAPNMKPDGFTQIDLVANGFVNGLVLGSDRVSSEPPLQAYVH